MKHQDDMKKIIVLGAGLSSSSLINYLIENAAQCEWTVTVADANKQLAESKIGNLSNATAIQLNADDPYEMQHTISQFDLVISLLPPHMHMGAAKACLQHKKHLITASYVSDEMRHLHTEAIKSGVLLLNECGLDPGIDHMSAMKVIHEIQRDGGVIDLFKSFCGGLVAPEFDDNPWHYKFTWNPRNVILAGQATASYLENGELKYIPPSRIFSQTAQIRFSDTLTFDAYANRDSLSYIKPYGITSAHTVLRGTLRGAGFCDAWNLIVKLGLADDQLKLEDADKITYRKWLNAFVPGSGLNQLEQRLCDFLQIDLTSEVFSKLNWLGIFDDTSIPLRSATSAQILQHLLQQKWKLQKGELDMIVMQHQFQYTQDEKQHYKTSSLLVKGENEVHTAMAKTVGLPMGIAAKLVLQGKLNLKGVQIPIMPELYLPVLDELENFGVKFIES